jgi:hypothetical protein
MTVLLHAGPCNTTCGLIAIWDIAGLVPAVACRTRIVAPVPHWWFGYVVLRRYRLLVLSSPFCSRRCVRRTITDVLPVPLRYAPLPV